MTKYVCIEDKVITSILDYKPNAPATVSVYEINDQDYEKIQNRTHYFDVAMRKIMSVPEQTRNIYEQQDNNIKHQTFLNSTDWMVLRHIREKALGTPTSLTEDKYLQLEQQRAYAAASIVK